MGRSLALTLSRQRARELGGRGNNRGRGGGREFDVISFAAGGGISFDRAQGRLRFALE